MILGYSDDISSCSAWNQALVWLSTGTNNGGENAVARRQRFALAAFFIASEGLTWTESSNWLSEKTLCLWYGVTCNSQSEAQSLVLDMNGLNGLVSS